STARPRRELDTPEAGRGGTGTVAEVRPGRTDIQAHALQELVARTASASAPAAPRAVDPDVEQRLRALGYVGSSISPRALETRRRGDPKDKIALYNLMKQAALDSVEGRLDEGISKVRRALA